MITPVLSKKFTVNGIHYKSEDIVDLHTGIYFGQEVLSVDILENWVEKDAKTVSMMPDLRKKLPDGLISINLTTASIIATNTSHVERAALACGNGNLVIEWVESQEMQSMVIKAAKILREWRENFHVAIAIDDYGTGQDGMGRFLLTQPDIVKLDGKLITSSRSNSTYRRAIENVCKWCASENVLTVAEWIETEEDFLIAKEAGASLGQGRYFNLVNIESV